MTHLHYTADLHRACAGPDTTPQRSRRFPVLVRLRTVVEVLRESIAACRHYERLRARGVSHDRAIRDSLGVGREPAATPPTTDPFWFAGRA